MSTATQNQSLEGKQFRYVDPPFGPMARSRFFLRGNVVMVNTPRGVQRAVTIDDEAKMREMIGNKLLVECEARE